MTPRHLSLFLRSAFALSFFLLLTNPLDAAWVRPGDSGTTTPRWGHRNGLQMGLPERGPRGLISIHMEPVTRTDHVLNFIAFEPVVNGARALSELEPSKLDGRQGKRLWSADAPMLDPKDPADLTSGTIQDHGATESLQVYIMCERFENGAHVYLRATFRSDEPNEVQFESFAATDSSPVSHFILTATMGNYARLRQLHLNDAIVTSGELWPNYRDREFAPAKTFPLDRLLRTRDGGVLVAASPDEKKPAAATAPGHWNFVGIPATQYWRLPASQTPTGTLARVNGRYTYWLSKNPIPGGISFENFELERPFQNGESSVFGVTTNTQALLKETAR